MSMNESNIVDKVAARLSLDISPALAQLQTLSDETTKALSSAQNAVTTGPKSNGDVYLANATGAIMNLRQAIKDLQLQFKEGELSAQDFYSKLQNLQQTYSSALDTKTGVGLLNDQALRAAVVNAESQLSKLQDFEMQSEAQLNRDKEASDQAYMDWWESALNTQTDNMVKQIKLRHDMQIQSAQDSADQLAQIYTEDYQRFADNIDKEISLIKQMNAYQVEADKMAMGTSAISGATSSGSIFANRSGSSSGLRIGPMNMAEMMAEFTGISMLTQNIMTGLVDITKQQQGLEQVFGQNISGQTQLNEVTNQFIDIAEKYGQSVTSVLDAAKQWGRQYHDVATAQQLVNSSTLLSIVDNMDMTQSAKSLEATMNALGMSVNNAADAQKSSMEIVDQWTNMAHNASVSAQDLAEGTQTAAGAARLAGVDLAQLNALVAAGVRNTGMSGSNIGNMYKTVFANIASDTPKIQKAFETLGISMTNADGSMKSAYELITELSAKMGTLDSSQKAAVLSITRGVQQYSKFAEAISNVNTIQQDYQVALNSSGKANQYAQEQLHTLSAELQRLRDEIQQMAYNAGSGGLGTMLAGLVRSVTDLIAGLQRLPAWLDTTVAGFGGVLLAGKMLTSMFNSFMNVSGMVRSGLDLLNTGMQRSLEATMNLAGGTQFLTADLDAKVVAQDASIAADGEQVAASGAASAALIEEGTAAETASAGFDMLDIASGGLTLALGAIVGTVAYVATGMGRASQSASQLNQQTQQLNASTKQLTQTDMQNAQMADSRIGQLEQLKSQYIAAKQAVDDATKGSVAYKTAEANLITVEQQINSIIGKNATDRIAASKNISQAFDNEAKAMIQSEITQIKAEQSLEEYQNSLTNTVVQQTNKRIQAYQAEQNAAQAAYTYIQSGPAAARFGLDRNGNVLGTAPNPAEDVSQNNIANIYRARQLGALAQLNQIAQSRGSDVYTQEINKLTALLNNPSAASGGSSSYYGGGTSGAGTASGSSAKGKSSGSSAHSKAMQDYLKNISDLTKSDSTGLQLYERNVTNAETSVKNMNTALSAGLTALKNNETSTKAASDVAKAYSGDVSALHTEISKLGSEDWKLIQEQDNVSQKTKQVNADFKDGKIDAQTHSQAIYQLGQEYDNLTKKLDSNRQAMVQDSQAIKQATQNVTSEITNMLQQAYTDQQTLEENALQNTYQPQIDALTAQKDAVDNLITSLQAQWQAQSNVNTLTDLQNQLSAVQADTSYRVVNQDGSVSWTYDQSKAADLQKQIADQQTKMQQDAEIQQLTDQKNALDAQITNLQNAYNEQKKQLDDYWTYKLTQDQLNQDADNLILNNGMSGALTIVQKYATDIIGQYDAIQKAAADAGEAIASANGGASISTSKVSSHGGPVKKTVKAANGGMVPLNLGVPGQDSVPAILSPGEIVAPSWNDLMSGMKSATSNSPSSMSLHVDKFVFPNVSTANDAQEFMESLVDQVTAALR